MNTSAFLRLGLMVTLAGTVAAHLQADDLEEGQRLYQIHCQACHGEDGKGNGPMRDQLEIEPPDLTTIATRHDGVFPRDQMHRVIDGRIELPLHGSRNMPVWGFTFQSVNGETMQEDDVEAMIDALTDYLDSIQIRP